MFQLDSTLLQWKMAGKKNSPSQWSFKYIIIAQSITLVTGKLEGAGDGGISISSSYAE